MTGFSPSKIVVPIDYSDDSRRAVDVALSINPDGAEVHVVYVAPVLNAVEPGLVWEAIADETRVEQLEKSYRERFSDAKYAGVKFHVAFGDPGHEIADYAEQIAAELIVMPSHGRTGLSRVLIGSVAERVVRLCHCPILVLRDGRKE